jgi:hypothetical protein
VNISGVHRSADLGIGIGEGKIAVPHRLAVAPQFTRFRSEADIQCTAAKNSL